MTTNVIQFPKTTWYLDEAVAYLKALGHRVSRRTLYNRISDGEGPRHAKKAGRLVFTKADLDAYDKAMTTTVQAFSR